MWLELWLKLKRPFMGYVFEKTFRRYYLSCLRCLQYKYRIRLGSGEEYDALAKDCEKVAE